MIKKIKQSICMLMTAAMLLGGIQVPVKAQEVQQQAEVRGESGITVTSREAFMNALAQRKSPITVASVVVIGNEAEANGRMRPVVIPENTVIRGTAGGVLCSRAPIQLGGDGVIFQDIELVFESSNALGSVPHREIFLAGHSLTLDNVNTYLEGAGNIGGMGGTEKELLPTVYAGGYTNTAVGKNASLTVRNSNEETMFQAIYMGHGAGADNHVPYQGRALLNLDAGALVREEVDVSGNSEASITITGNGNQVAKAKQFYGNENTTMMLSKVFMENAVVDGVGNMVLSDGACLAPETQNLRNVTLQSGACLDFNGVGNAVIAGNLVGEISPSQEQGILVLNEQGTLTILGKVTGTTQFQTRHRLFPGMLLAGKSYIFAEAGNTTKTNFVLADKKIEEGYELKYDGGIWTVQGASAYYREIGSIEIQDAPSHVDLRKITTTYEEVESGKIPDENEYFAITWYDKNGEAFSDNDIIETDWFYDVDYVIKVRTDLWG